MVLTPLGVRRGATLVDRLLRGVAAEDKPNVELRVIALDVDHLGSVGSLEPTLSLDDDAVAQIEVWGVRGLTCGHFVLELQLLVVERMAG